MSWNERIALYEKIEAHRKRPLIVYVTSKREGVYSMMSTDALPKIIEQIAPRDLAHPAEIEPGASSGTTRRRRSRMLAGCVRASRMTRSGKSCGKLVPGLLMASSFAFRFRVGA